MMVAGYVSVPAVVEQWQKDMIKEVLIVMLVSSVICIGVARLIVYLQDRKEKRDEQRNNA